MYRDIPEDLRALIEPVVEDHGCELVDVEEPGASGGTLRVVVDSEENDGRVPVDLCVAISREIETALDAADAIPSRYRLEVSSPGLDRVLAREKDFRVACGSEVKIKTRRPLAGRRRFRGELIDFDGSTVRLVIDGRRVEIPFAEVEKAHMIYEFTRADFDARRGG